MRKWVALILIFLVTAALCACADNHIEQNQTQEPDVPAVETISGEAVIPEKDNTEIADTPDVIAALANLPDRIPNSKNNDKAAQWLAGQYVLLELEPLVKEDYFWPYEQKVYEETVMPNNVVGYIAGSDPAQAVVISCHFDAVIGSAGAVDNASGVAAMLRTAANISAAENKLNADIIFCAFNGEEQYYAGSSAFVEEFLGLYETVYNINYDCVGVIDAGAYMFGAKETEVGYVMNKEIRPYLEKYNIECNNYSVSGVRSDHISFEHAQIPNINFTQVGIMSVTHSSNDQIDKLDIEQINLLADCVTEYLLTLY